ncbi:MAG: hypothetical protein B6D37_05585 [Sphingobacteriales bacterium UTBCD1]|jgi:hypothetical protein|nr:MAG: hypothetical protein B6D37_05585 [Sphingobacteriales bacterium UTBCD1]
MQMNSPKKYYQSQIEKLDFAKKRLLKQKSLYSILRLLIAVLAIIALWELWGFSVVMALLAFWILVAVFVFVVTKDLKNKETLENNRSLKNICKEEIRIHDFDFQHLPGGAEFCPAHHAYAQDLDLFGKASLYQYLNRTRSEQGHKNFANRILNPSSKETIAQMHEACNVLTQNPGWSLQFQAHGISHPITLASESKINEWRIEDDPLKKNPWLRLIRIAFPAMTTVSLFLFLFEIIPGSLFTFFLITYFAVSSYISKIFQPQYAKLNRIVPELETMEQCIRMIESNTFDSSLFRQLKEKISIHNETASRSIGQLKKILARLDYRYNPVVYIPLNSFFLWDLQQFFALGKWKTKYSDQIPLWFEAIAETESLISVGSAAFNHPGWCYPEFSSEKYVFIAGDMGHPLIPLSKRVNNSFSTRGIKQVNLITGSNMAGKSTFLRSVGVNAILAMMGAPVCCNKLTISEMKIMSSMRISDNLEENTSTFYAELKKLKEIIEAIRNQETVFILLDEILRGTNSADRHTGSIALLKQLIRENVSCIVATHDLELAALAGAYPGDFHNYHFDVQVQNEELFFDYKIKEGICQSMNASLLMKKIGIEL